MEWINNIVGVPLGWLMWACYQIFHQYGWALVLFTLLTKVITFPLNLLVQKNSIKMVRMKPQLDALRYQYVDDKDAFLDAQSALYKKEHYSPMAGVWPLLIQLPIIFGLLDVVYNPLKYILRLPVQLQNAFVEKTAELMQVPVAELGSTAQLTALEAVRSAPEAFTGISGSVDAVEAIQSMSLSFFGINLMQTPSVAVLDSLWLVPVLAGASALLMCWIQNKINVLQIEQSSASQWGMTIFMVAFSTFFAFIVPAAVGLYWTFGNIFSIGVMYLVNAVYPPAKYINYAKLEAMKRTAQEEKMRAKENAVIAKRDYREFFAPENQKDMKVVFYSEGSGYYKYFENLIEALLRDSDVTIHYITSDPNDAIFQKEEPRLKPYYADEPRLIPLMMKLQADIVVMTTPDLEKYHIKRSKVKPEAEYIYLDHGCTSLNLTYRTGALDYFNTVFVVSREQAVEVRALEKLRNTPKKRIVEYGYGLIDNMIASYGAADQSENAKKTVLIAPSWQHDNIMDSCLDDLIEALDGKGFRIVVRPHPQYVRRFPARIKELQAKFQDRISDDFVFETDFASNATVYNADLLITDWSAIAFEYSFTTDKPTLFINTEMKVVNKDYQKIAVEPFDITARSLVGRQIEKTEVSDVLPVVLDLLDHQDSYRDRINELKQRYFYNLGHSGEAGAKYILHRLARKYGDIPDPDAKPGV